jgi:hypothetical protein
LKRKISRIKDTWDESDSSDDTLTSEQQTDFEKLQLLVDQAKAMTEGFQECKLSGTSLAEFKMEARALEGQLVTLYMKLSGARKDALNPFLIEVRKTRVDLMRLAAKMMDNEAKTAPSPITPPINHVQTLNIPSHRTSSPKRTPQSALDSAEHELEVYIRSLSLARLPAQSMLDDLDTLRTAVEVDLPQVRRNIDECKRSLARYTPMPQADSVRIQRANKAWESAHNWAESVYQKF